MKTDRESQAPRTIDLSDITWDTEDAGTDDISNLMPACRMCNQYKRANSIETFLRYIREIPRKLRDNYIYKVGLAYGNVTERKSR